ncbi:hypothetical protein [Blastococcus sp. TML/C7B]|uniref:hypothetical protein n=1 Tax=Blastococcus sp. TML/C7B TaxID=2798728 RepID=UPI001F5B82BE|nr:hypothetical protein [Blastococcus sp. TML/C7B]
MSQMMRSGIGAAMSATTSIRAVARLGLGAGLDQHLVDDADHGVEDLLEHPGREGLGDDPPDPRVPRVVHADHRAVELAEVGRQVLDGHRALARAEGGRLGADRVEVGEAGDRPVAGAGLHALHHRLLEVGDGALGAQLVEDRVPDRRRLRPEVAVGEVDRVDVERIDVDGAGRGVHGHGAPHCRADENGQR